MKLARGPDTWIDYWNSETVFRPIMERTALHFVRRLKAVFPFSRDEVLLDFGCGPGYLVGRLAGSAKEIHGVDTSSRMISECREKFGNLANVRFHLLDPSNYTDLSFLGAKRFSVIICLSVVQYFDQILQVENLIRSLHRVAAPGARLLIADIPVGNTPLGDALDLLRAAAREGFFLEACRFLLQAATSRYARTRAARGLLIMPVSALQQVVSRLALEARILKEPLTYSRRRVHLLVKYD